MSCKKSPSSSPVISDCFRPAAMRLSMETEGVCKGSVLMLTGWTGSAGFEIFAGICPPFDFHVIKSRISLYLNPIQGFLHIHRVRTVRKSWSPIYSSEKALYYIGYIGPTIVKAYFLAV